MKYAKKPTICVVGLGYVGLPLAVLFGKSDLKTYGFDLNKTRIQELKKNYDRTRETSKKELQETKIEFSDDPKIINKADFIIIAVPTPIDAAHQPDLSPVRSASQIVGSHLKKNSVVVFESTVYPGVTEDVCKPLIEKFSGLVCGKDWVIGYSPERTVPGDRAHTTDLIMKITSGMDNKSAKYIDAAYKKIIKAGTYLAKDIKTAEAAKVIENTQRDINIAIVNELSVIFNQLGLNTYDVLEAAGTKWNFLRFKPGLVGGHCIGVDPYYLVYKAEVEGYHPQLISVARRINDNMSAYCAQEIVKLLIKAGKIVNQSKILVMGATFKEDVKDTRNSKITELIKELRDYDIEVYLLDPLLSYEELRKDFLVDKDHFLTDFKNLKNFDGICYAVDHEKFRHIKLSTLLSICKKNPILFDIKGHFRNINTTQKLYYQTL
jgi:UDP-N-acetyl-D-galactosamine dehydrogenase